MNPQPSSALQYGSVCSCTVATGGYCELNRAYDKVTVSFDGGKSSSEDGTGKSVPMTTTWAPRSVAFAQNERGELRLESDHGQLAGTLSADGGKPDQGRPTVAGAVLRARTHGMSVEQGGPPFIDVTCLEW